jgi:hypothetical protein
VLKVKERHSGCRPSEKEVPERRSGAFHHKNIPGCYTPLKSQYTSNETTGSYSPESCHLQTRRRENLKSHKPKATVTDRYSRTAAAGSAALAAGVAAVCRTNSNWSSLYNLVKASAPWNLTNRLRQCCCHLYSSHGRQL